MRIAFCLFGYTDAKIAQREFYVHDLQALRALGHDVVPVFSPLTLVTKRFDVAFVWWWNYLALWGPAAKIRGLPIIVTGVFDDDEFHTWPRWKRLVKRTAARLSDLNVFVSRNELERWPATGWFRRDSARYSPLGIDTNLYVPGPPRPASGPFTIFNVAYQSEGNLRRKLIFELVRAFARLHRERGDVRLALAGEPGDATPQLEEAIAASGAGAAIEFLGEVTRQEKMSRMQSCSVYVQVSRHEGFGFAVAEAMACGAPVIVANVSETPVLVGDCGIYAREPSEEGILDALRWCADHRAELPAIGARGRERVVSTFSIDRRSRDFAGLLQEAMSRTR